MKRHLLLITLAAAAGTACADLVFSGRSWTTSEPAPNQYGTQPAYQVNGADSATATGAWNLWASMWTPVSLAVGDAVSYDYFLTKELRNTWGGGDSDYIEDSWVGFLAPNGGVLDPPTFTYLTAARHSYYNDGTTLYNDVGGSGNAGGTTPGTGIHFDWVFDSPTSYTLDVTDVATGTPIAQGWTGTLTGGTTLADIELFVAGAWNTEQDITLANFTITQIPEPSTVLLVALGGLGLLRRRFRRR